MSNHAKLTPFGKLVRKHRIDHGMLLGTMAGGVGISSSHLSNLETGRKGMPSIDLVNKIADLLELNPRERAELHSAAQQSSNIVRLEVEKTARGSDVVAKFARRFDHLTDEQIARMRAILGEGE